MTEVDSPTPPPVVAHRRRGLVIWAIIVVASLIAVVSATNVWVKRQALDTDNWVEASDKLLQDPDIQQALSEFLVSELYANVDVAGELEDRLPDDWQGIAGPLSAALREPATEAVSRLLATNQAQSLWQEVNRKAHTVLVGILEDDVRFGSTAGGVVTLDLGELVVALGQQLGIPQSALDKIPADAGNIVVARSDQLSTLQTTVKIIKWLSVILLLLVIGLYALAVYLAKDARRETLRNVGWAVVLVGLILLVIRRLTGNYVVSMVDLDSYRPAARAAFQIGSQLLAEIAWASVIYGIVIIGGTILAGPTRIGTWARRTIAPAMNAQPWLVWGGAAVVFLLLVLWSPTPAFEMWSTALLLAALFAGGIAALRHQTLHEFPDASFAAVGSSIGSTAEGMWSSVSSRFRGSRAKSSKGQDIEHLERLKDLHERGGLTDAEFESAKRAILEADAP